MKANLIFSWTNGIFSGKRTMNERMRGQNEMNEERTEIVTFEDIALDYFQVIRMRNPNYTRITSSILLSFKEYRHPSYKDKQ